MIYSMGFGSICTPYIDEAQMVLFILWKPITHLRDACVNFCIVFGLALRWPLFT